MRSYPFFVVLAIIVGVVLYQSFQPSKLEGFQSSPKGASPALNVPATKPAPTPLAGEGDPQPFAPPSTSLLAPPPGQLATVNSYPYEDPAMKKAPMARVLNVLETIKGFLANEAPGLAQFNDSSVQLPLETVKADRSRLEDEANFMRRNPGVDGSLSEKDLDEMTANLGYLQKKWRLSANSAPLANVEGFQSGGTSTSILGDILSMFGLTAPSLLSSAAAPMAPMTAPMNLDGIPAPSFGGNTTTTTQTSTTQPATLAQLRELSLKISAEITRLQASGTTDPIVTQRVNLLTQIRKGVDDIIKGVESGAMAPGNVPITEDAVNQFLPVISNVSSALPPLLNQMGASSALNNLFPAYGAGDISGAQVAQDLFTKYAEDFLKNISWDINVRYTGASERAVAQNIASAVASAALPQAPALGVGGPSEAPPSTSPYRGWFDNILASFPGAPSGTGAATPMPTGSTAASGTHATGVLVTDATHAPGSLDWKERSRQICDQVTKRGLNAYEFGCLQDPESVSANFSYRGYAKMVCARLATHYDPGVPEACGCPPPTWVGWRP